MTTVPTQIPNTADSDLPPVLLPYQQRWIGDSSPLKVMEKGRRTGVTWSEAADNVLTAAAAKAAGGQNVYYIAYNQDMTVEYIEAAAMWARAFNYAASEIEEGIWPEDTEDRHIKTFTIRFPDSGHRVVALTSRPSNLRGRQGVIVIDEAAFHDDLPGLLKAALAMLIWGGQVHVISTHNGDTHAFNELIGEIRNGKRAGSVQRVPFSTAVDEGLYERVCLRLGIERTDDAEAAWIASVYDFYGSYADEELDCIPAAGSGVYFPRALVERCQRDGIPVVRFARHKEWYLDDKRLVEGEAWARDHLQPILDNLPGRRTVFGQDFGRDGDLSVIWVLQESAPGQWDTALIVELRRIPFDVQQLVLFFVVDRLPLWHHGKLDGRGNGQSHAEAAQQRYGVSRIECVMASPTWYAVSFPRYRAAYEDKSITVPRSEDIIADHRRVVLDKGRPRMDDGRDKGSDGEYRHGDSAIAGLLAWMATLQEGQPPAGATVEHDPDNYQPLSARGRRVAGMFAR